MIREFSEEKKEELYRILTSIDDSPCGTFWECCGSRRYEFGDWMDRLCIATYMGKMEQYHMRLIDINTSIRSQIDTVFSNVYDIDKKYGSIFQNYAEIVERQKQRIDDMTAVLREGNNSKKISKSKSHNLDEDIDRWLENVSIAGFKSRLSMYRHGEQYGVDYETLQSYLQSMLDEHIITQTDYEYLSGVIINYGHVPSLVEETITKEIYERLLIREQYIATVDEKIEEVKSTMSSDNPKAIVEYRLLCEYRNDILTGKMTIQEIEGGLECIENKYPQMFDNVGMLYKYSNSDCEKQIEVIKEQYEAIFVRTISISDVEGLKMGGFSLLPIQEETFVISWNSLKQMGLSKTQIVAVLANMYSEGEFSPINAQNSSYPGIENSEYVYDCYDSIGYGICQWTFSSRKQGLLEMAIKKEGCVSDIDVQLAYFQYEMEENGDFDAVWIRFLEVEDRNDAVEIFYRDIESPAASLDSSNEEYYDELKKRIGFAEDIETWYDSMHGLEGED